MKQKDEFAGLIAFLFEQDCKAHPPPGDLLNRILHEIENQRQRSDN